MKARLGILMKYPLGSAAVVAFLVVLLLMGWRRVTEPRVMGQGIREWVQDLPYDARDDADAKVAINQLGFEAIPYLLEVIDGPSSVKLWVARKIPLLVETGVMDPQADDRVSGAALGHLAGMVREEARRNEEESRHDFPIREAIWPHLIEVLRANTESLGFSTYFYLLTEMGPLKPEVLEILRGWWGVETKKTMPWGPRGLHEAALILARQGDPAVLVDFLEAAQPTNSQRVRLAALKGIAQMGLRTAPVNDLLSATVQDPVAEIRDAGLRACASLGYLPSNLKLPALETLSRDLPVFSSDVTATQVILHWVREPENPKAIELVKENFGDSAPPPHRRFVLELLRRNGPRASCFVPSLVEQLNDPMPWVRAATMKALNEIDPARAEQERRRLTAKEAPGAVTVAE